MMMGNTIRWGLACALAVCCNSLAAEEGKNVWEEYGKRVKSSASVGALGPDLFGDQVSMSDGSLSFSVTDVSLAGNNALPVAFTRTFKVRNSNESHTYNDFSMEDWEIDLPNISGVFASEWIVANSATPNQRCSVAPGNAGGPPAVWVGDIQFESKDFWQGHNLSLPSGGGELLLLPAGRPLPTAGGPYHWVTNDQTRVACLPSIRNWSEGGEGFLATTPDGTRYWFDWMGQTREPELIGTKSHIVTPWPNKHVIHIRELQARRRNTLYPTRVEDRFGNTVEYEYTNARDQPVRLTQIKSSDGRQIRIGYNTAGAVSAVTTGTTDTRTWKYEYAGVNSFDHTLTGVIQPDGSRWNISFANLLAANVEYHVTDNQEIEFRSCTKHPAVIEPRVFHGSVTHPSGAKGEFTLNVVAHRRTNVPVLCDNFTSPNNIKSDDLAIWPLYHHGLSLAKKRITGPGLTPLEWDYSYFSTREGAYYPGDASAEFPVCTDSNVDCSVPRCVSDDCAGASTTTVTDANGDWIRHSYGNSYRYNEGKLLSIEVGTGNAPALRSTVNTYDLSQADKAYPARFGISPRSGWEGFTSAYHRPQLSKIVHQDGATFSRATYSFDQFANPLSVASSSSLGFSRTQSTVYHHNFSKWVLGQVASSAIDGVVTGETSYDPVTALPIRSTSFGKLQHTLSYRSDGTLAAVTDGRDLTTALSSWKRGIPQLIEHPDGTTQSAIVDDRGWMSSIADENGFRTCFTYDVMGRTASVTYPAETRATICDRAASSRQRPSNKPSGIVKSWNPTTQAFESVGSSEFGIAAGHWRQTVSTGNAQKLTYFDALWRPLLTHEYDSADEAGTQRFQQNTYDHAGRVSFASYPGSTSSPGTGIWTEYDALGRVTSVAQDSELGALITLTKYGPGLQTQVTNPRGFTTTTQYQAWDVPGYDLPVRMDAPESAATEIVRDVFGKPLEIKRGEAN